MFRESNLRILAIDDDETICEQIKSLLEGEESEESQYRLTVQIETVFENALPTLKKNKIDIVILDVRLGPVEDERTEEEGIKTLEKIKELTFVPVIFYTALPNAVNHLKSNFVKVIEKSDGPEKLISTVNEIIQSKIIDINRALVRKVEIVQRDYMWSFVDENWNLFNGEYEPETINFLLSRRLAMSLNDNTITDFRSNLREETDEELHDDKIHSIYYYILPPLKVNIRMGEIYKGILGEVDGYWILLTPSCDLVEGRGILKAEKVILAGCKLLSTFEEYTSFLDDKSNAKKKKLKALLNNNRKDNQSERYHYLPSVINIPDLVADFQMIVNVEHKLLNGLEHIATLDSPFSEEFLNRFVRYYGRIGTPDLELESILNKFDTN